MTHTVRSPAKVNLLLKVISRRPDGYHNLVSVVDIISLHDILEFTESNDGVVSVKDDKGILPDGPPNTIYRAITTLRDTYGTNKGVHVLVRKQIPIGSGLGGPSSNAATALETMARVWGLPAGGKALHEIGRKIGADVPLFLHGRPCVMRGIGDQISPVDLPFMWYLIVYPNVSISTRRVYEGLKISLTKKENDIKLLGKFNTIQDVSSILENDLEKTGMSICPIIQTIKDRLIEAGSAGALMSGSGSSVFGIFEKEMEARKASTSLSNMGSVFVAHSAREGEL
jgi:4-diphosphocytidyl-2-C-methyl-D-erythritol kinase